MFEKDRKEFFNSLEEHSKIKLKGLTKYIKKVINNSGYEATLICFKNEYEYKFDKVTYWV